jgi:F-type H+-transporting ATPase subunit epsilon
MQKINLSIIAKNKIAYQGEADSITIPTEAGIITVLPRHAELVSALKKGIIVLKNDKEVQEIEISGGVLEVKSKSNVIILLA